MYILFLQAYWYEFGRWINYTEMILFVLFIGDLQLTWPTNDIFDISSI